MRDIDRFRVICQSISHLRFHNYPPFGRAVLHNYGEVLSKRQNKKHIGISPPPIGYAELMPCRAEAGCEKIDSSHENGFHEKIRNCLLLRLECRGVIRRNVRVQHSGGENDRDGRME